jgi:23S rRNA (uridine2552-2'-O)-methyltransferase
MSRKKPVSAWMRRHINDPYVKQATKSGYRSRAAYKLQEIDQKDRLLRPGAVVVDLGSTPGGWSQIARERVGASGTVVALDVLPMQPVGGVTFIQGDALDDAVIKAVIDIVGERSVDLVLSDMAPNLTGIASVDEARSQSLVMVAVAFAQRVLKPTGGLLVKVFHGSGLDAVIREMKQVFAQVVIRKPSASRSESREVYVLCRGLSR